MAKKESKNAYLFQTSMREALLTFNLKKLKEWMKKYNQPLLKSFEKQSEETQMASMCKLICNRTDLLGSEVHHKAIKWLKDHNYKIKGRLF